VGDFNREGLVIEVDFSLSAERVIRFLEQNIDGEEKLRHYASQYAARIGRTAQNILLEYIQPGKPQQNACVERCNRTIHYDWLAQYLFETIAEEHEFATCLLWAYNYERPNMAVGCITPKQKLAYWPKALLLSTAINGRITIEQHRRTDGKGLRLLFSWDESLQCYLIHQSLYIFFCL
jgi:transposase InsO family protein